MKAIVVIFAIILVAVCLPFLMAQISQFQADEFTDTIDGVITGEAESSADVILTLELFQDKLTSVNSISSNITESATVTPSSYVAATRILTVNGLKASDNRTLTLKYKTDALADVTGLSLFVSMWPFFLILGGGFFIWRIFRR